MGNVFSSDTKKALDKCLLEVNDPSVSEGAFGTDTARGRWCGERALPSRNRRQGG